MKIFQKNLSKKFNKLSPFIKSGDTIYIEIDLMRFTKFKGSIKDREKYLSFFFKLFKKLVGSAGTIIVPSFSYSWGDDKKEKLFDIKKTACKTGIFPEYLRKQKKVIRTLDPMFSFLIFGKNSKNYSKIGNDSFGKKSLFEKINNKSTKLISFGLNRFDPTFVHYVEQFFDENFKKLKYRFLKEFKGTLINKSLLKKKSKHFAFMRPKNSKIIFSEKKIKKSLEKDKKLQKIKIGHGLIYIVKASDFFSHGIKGLQKDTNFFIKKNV